MRLNMNILWSTLLLAAVGSSRGDVIYGKQLSEASTSMVSPAISGMAEPGSNDDNSEIMKESETGYGPYGAHTFGGPGSDGGDLAVVVTGGYKVADTPVEGAHLEGPGIHHGPQARALDGPLGGLESSYGGPSGPNVPSGAPISPNSRSFGALQSLFGYGSPKGAYGGQGAAAPGNSIGGGPQHSPISALGSGFGGLFGYGAPVQVAYGGPGGIPTHGPPQALQGFHQGGPIGHSQGAPIVLGHGPALGHGHGPSHSGHGPALPHLASLGGPQHHHHPQHPSYGHGHIEPLKAHPHGPNPHSHHHQGHPLAAPYSPLGGLFQKARGYGSHVPSHGLLGHPRLQGYGINQVSHAPQHQTQGGFKPLSYGSLLKSAFGLGGHHHHAPSSHHHQNQPHHAPSPPSSYSPSHAYGGPGGPGPSLLSQGPGIGLGHYGQVIGHPEGGPPSGVEASPSFQEGSFGPGGPSPFQGFEMGPGGPPSSSGLVGFVPEGAGEGPAGPALGEQGSYLG